MSDDAEYTIGTAVLCSDGERGYHLTRVVIDPVVKVLRYLVVEPRLFEGLGRLVPIEKVASATDEIRLSCTIAEFEALPFAEETRFIPAAEDDHYHALLLAHQGRQPVACGLGAPTLESRSLDGVLK